jgi:hypothetical protein
MNSNKSTIGRQSNCIKPQQKRLSLKEEAVQANLDSNLMRRLTPIRVKREKKFLILTLNQCHSVGRNNLRQAMLILHHLGLLQPNRKIIEKCSNKEVARSLHLITTLKDIKMSIESSNILVKISAHKSQP